MPEERRTRGDGSIYRRKGSACWWIKYHRNGRPYRESTHTMDEGKARKFLKLRLAEITSDTFIDPKSRRVRVQELAEDFLRDYRINERKSIADAEDRWDLHLKPAFGNLRAADVSADLLKRYVDKRQQERGKSGTTKNGTINRELAALKRMFTLGLRAKKVNSVPYFPHLEERNVRKGFLEDAMFSRLANECAKEGLWLRAILELGSTYGWREAELLGMRACQVDLAQRVIRLEPGTTKNDEGREVEMTPAVFALLTALMAGKEQEEYVFTREGGGPVRDFRRNWWRACTRAGLGRLMCFGCGQTVESGQCRHCKTTDGCRKCGKNRSQHRKSGHRFTACNQLRYAGLIFHDLRRTAARNLRRAGVAEGVIMKIGGWKTRSVFERYAIVSRSDIQDAMRKLEQSRADYRGSPTVVPHVQFGHSLGTSPRNPKLSSTRVSSN